MKPTKPIHPNPNWRYTVSGKTDIAATFRRLRREAELEKAQPPVLAKRKVGAGK